jgi:hypothetical protein
MRLILFVVVLLSDCWYNIMLPVESTVLHLMPHVVHTVYEPSSAKNIPDEMFK